MTQINCEFANKCDEYECFVTSEIFTKEVTFIGSHKPEKTNQDVTRLVLLKCTFTEFPQNIHDFFPNLTIFNILCSQLDEIRREHVAKLEHLKQFQIFGSDLKKISGDTFKGSKQLEGIRLTHNNLSVIEPDIFQGLKSLTFVNLTENEFVISKFEQNKSGYITLQKLNDFMMANFIENAEKSDQIAYHKRKMCEVENQNQAREEEHARVLAETIESHQQTVIKIQHDHNEMEDTNAYLKQILESQEEKISSQQQQIDQMQVTIQSLELEKDKSRSKIEGLLRGVVEYDQLVVNLEEDANAFEQLMNNKLAELDEILGSK
jgi:hypothetical protein